VCEASMSGGRRIDPTIGVGETISLPGTSVLYKNLVRAKREDTV
jgi:hypothetical protein